MRGACLERADFLPLGLRVTVELVFKEDVAQEGFAAVLDLVFKEGILLRAEEGGASVREDALRRRMAKTVSAISNTIKMMANSPDSVSRQKS